MDTGGPKGPAAASYAGAVVSVVSSLTLTEIGIIIGIVTALLTFAFNVIYGWRRERREQAIHDAQLAWLKDGANRRKRDLPVEVNRRLDGKQDKA